MYIIIVQEEGKYTALYTLSPLSLLFNSQVSLQLFTSPHRSNFLHL